MFQEWETHQNDCKNKRRLPDPSLTLFLGLLIDIFLGAKGPVSIEENQDRHPCLSFEATPGKNQNPLLRDAPKSGKKYCSEEVPVGKFSPAYARHIPHEE